MTPTPNPQPPIPVSRASIRTWLLSRQPSPPVTLATKLDECVELAPDAIFAGDSVSAVVGALGTWLLDAVVERRKSARDTALDLLAADAFVTYAFEAASEEGADVTGLADQFLTRVRA